MLVATKLVQSEGFFALYSGLSAVMAGIVPKMAVRFSSFDIFKGWLGDREGRNKGLVFLAGLGSGMTEAVLVVTPAEVCKIRMQTQERYIRLADGKRTSSSTLKYRGVLQTAAVIVREEGLGALYKGLAPTVLRQGCNQAVNFTFYQLFKTQLSAYLGKDELLPWQHMLLGGLSGGFGPCINNPLDVVKTRLQKQVVIPGKPPKYGGFVSAIGLIAREEGVPALWKGLAPRLMRIMPGQAITFMTYEWVSKRLLSFSERQHFSRAPVETPNP
ncbi:unnamed protein product [Ascophyllum nodosum]